MKIYKIAFEWWEPFPIVRWILDAFMSPKWQHKVDQIENEDVETEVAVVPRKSDFSLKFNTTTLKLLFGGDRERAEADCEISTEVEAQEDDEVLPDRKLILETLTSMIENIKVSLAAKECAKVELSNAVQSQQSPASGAAVIKVNCSFDSVRYVIKKLGLKEAKGDWDWDVLWTSQPLTQTICARLAAHQRVSRFPGSEVLVSKNVLAACLTKMFKSFPREYDFFPKSWSLPEECSSLEAYARAHNDAWIIVKPHKGYGGKGIFLTQDIYQLRKCRRMLGQVYIQRPYLMDGLKFDVRIYVLIPSCEPLRIFVYNEALARFATVEYAKPDERNRRIMCMHLTNYSLNKQSPTYVVDENKGTLRRFSTIKKRLNTTDINATQVSSDIDDIIIKTIIAMLPTLRYNYYTTFPSHSESISTFQIFGFDVLFDKNLKAYVLEVNGTPSLQADVPLDIEMTNALVVDTFNLLQLSEPCKRSESKRRIEWENSHMGNFRKIYPNGNVSRYDRYLNVAGRVVLKRLRAKT